MSLSQMSEEHLCFVIPVHNGCCLAVVVVFLSKTSRSRVRSWHCLSYPLLCRACEPPLFYFAFTHPGHQEL